MRANAYNFYTNKEATKTTTKLKLRSSAFSRNQALGYQPQTWSCFSLSTKSQAYVSPFTVGLHKVASLRAHPPFHQRCSPKSWCDFAASSKFYSWKLQLQSMLKHIFPNPLSLIYCLKLRKVFKLGTAMRLFSIFSNLKTWKERLNSTIYPRKLTALTLSPYHSAASCTMGSALKLS